MSEDQQKRLLDCILASAQMIADQLGSATTELQEINRNLYDMDSKLSAIASRIEQIQ